jgi:SHAQKYF class myb-like DNA-binding protein
MYGKVQFLRSKKRFNIAACEAVVHESGATNFDVSVPVPYSIFSRLPHVAPEFLPVIIQGAPVAYPLSLSTADTRETSRARQSKEGTRSRSNAASAQVNDEASYANVRSDVMQAAYEAGCRMKLVRLQNMRNALQPHHPDTDFSGFTPKGLFPNMSLADIEALDEAAFLAPIKEWKRANNILREETGCENTGRWSDEEHTRFLHGLELFGRKYTKVAGHVGTRTYLQVKNHAQKYFKKLEKARPAPADPTAPAPAAAPKPKGSKKRKATIAALDVDASSSVADIRAAYRREQAEQASRAAASSDDDEAPEAAAGRARMLVDSSDDEDAAPWPAPEQDDDEQDAPVPPLPAAAAAPFGAVAVSPFDMDPFSGALQPLDVVEVAALREASALDDEALAARAWETPPLPPPLDDCALESVLADLDAQSRQATAAPAPVVAARAAPAPAPVVAPAPEARAAADAAARAHVLAAAAAGRVDVEAMIRELQALLER